MPGANIMAVVYFLVRGHGSTSMAAPLFLRIFWLIFWLATAVLMLMDVPCFTVTLSFAISVPFLFTKAYFFIHPGFWLGWLVFTVCMILVFPFQGAPCIWHPIGLSLVLSLAWLVNKSKESCDLCSLIWPSVDVNPFAPPLLSEWRVNVWQERPLLRYVFMKLYRNDTPMGPRHVIYRSKNNVRDAIKITLELEFSYIWIDSLCIIQDSSDDWNAEAARIGSYYAGAECTLASTGSESGDGGCFHSRPHSQSLRPCCVAVSYSGIFGAFTGASRVWTQIRRDEMADFHRGVDNASLNRRGWVLQERMLSCRILHFGADMMYWECCARSASELCPGGFVYKKHPEEYYGDYLPRTTIPTDGSDGHLSRSWNRTAILRRRVAQPDLVTDFGHEKPLQTPACLTYTTDLFIAMKGIVDKIQSTTNDDLVAGMWKDHLVECLLWFMAKGPSQRMLETQKGKLPGEIIIGPQIAPTWSWLSVEGSVTIDQLPTNAHRKVFLKSLAVICSATVQPVVVDGQQQKRHWNAVEGVLEIQAPLLRIARLTHRKDSSWRIHTGGWERSGFLHPARFVPDLASFAESKPGPLNSNENKDVPEDPNTESDLFCVSLLMLRRQTEILFNIQTYEVQGIAVRHLHGGQAEDVFERVGFFSTDPVKQWWRIRHFDMAPLKLGRSITRLATAATVQNASPKPTPKTKLGAVSVVDLLPVKRIRQTDTRQAEVGPEQRPSEPELELAQLTRQNLARFNRMKRKAVDSEDETTDSPTTTDTTTVSTTASAFAMKAFRNGIRVHTSTKPPTNLAEIEKRFKKPRKSVSPTESEHRLFTRCVEDADNEATMVFEVGHQLLKKHEDSGYKRSFGPSFKGLPKNAGFNNGLSAPQPDFVEGLRMEEYDPFPVDEYINGAVLCNFSPRSVTLPHLAGEWKGPSGNMRKAELQSAYDGAAMVYARNQALSYLEQPDRPGYAVVTTFTTDGTSLNLYAHYTSCANDDTTQYHQYRFASANLTTYQGYKNAQRGIRNEQDHAKAQSYALRDQLQAHWKKRCAALKNAIKDTPNNKLAQSLVSKPQLSGRRMSPRLLVREQGRSPNNAKKDKSSRRKRKAGADP
ncbi:heterokaryon incompatibility protein [Grosmannia clavigera kw1407]|uniref:Heterokaryon incompatibility protein n=1 Tax=Grosmannia clavigera (strain kw1407 / UAMH 11150) TaxID=655863 RepID=F0XKN3_GROCL|nr:heterokaryon incompatibility protein [Grosmannia clavigera kw1407]EFX01617.1 heterokaryon incompatibility protein [Grosmannia clavigera kw1407]